jgi:hypothetical protein
MWCIGADRAVITLALDLSMRRTGWAIGDGWPMESGSLEGDSGMNEGSKFLLMDRQITGLIETTGPDQVIYPEYHNTRNADAAKQSLGLRALLLRRCAVKRLKCVGVEERHYRKVVGVNCSTKLTAEEEADFQRRLSKRTKGTKGVTRRKVDMKARVEKVLEGLNLKFGDDDEADAILLLIAHSRVKCEK